MAAMVTNDIKHDIMMKMHENIFFLITTFTAILNFIFLMKGRGKWGEEFLALL